MYVHGMYIQPTSHERRVCKKKWMKVVTNSTYRQQETKEQREQRLQSRRTKDRFKGTLTCLPTHPVMT